MRKMLSFLAACALVASAQASWYWPFGSGGSGGEQARLSELTEKASELIDEADDLVGDGKREAAVEKYREALAELDRVERENPERAATPEFQTVRTKRGLVTSAISQINMAEARENAKAVRVTDTTELEARLGRLRESRRLKPSEGESLVSAPKMESELEDFRKVSREEAKRLDVSARRAKVRRGVREEIERLQREDPASRRAALLKAGELLREGKTGEAHARLAALVEAEPGDPAALNLLGVCCAIEGDADSARAILLDAFNSRPDDWHAGVNLANLTLQAGGDKALARRYYEAAVARGAPTDAKLEEALR